MYMYVYIHMYIYITGLRTAQVCSATWIPPTTVISRPESSRPWSGSGGNCSSRCLSPLDPGDGSIISGYIYIYGCIYDI